MWIIWNQAISYSLIPGAALFPMWVFLLAIISLYIHPRKVGAFASTRWITDTGKGILLARAVLKFRDAESCPRSSLVDRFLGYSGRLSRSMTLILLLVLLLIAAGCALWKWGRTSGFFCCVAGLFFWSVGSGLPAQWLLTDLQAAYANDAPPEWGKRNAIVMLGAGTVQIPDAHQVEAGTLAYARILKTFALYQACRKSGQRCTVIVSGGDAQHHGLFGSGGLWRHIARPGRCGFRAAA